MRLSSGPEHSLLTNRPVIVTQSDLLSSSPLPLQKRGSPYSVLVDLIVDTLSPSSGPLCAHALSSFKQVKSLAEFNALNDCDIQVDDRINDACTRAPRLLDQVRDAVRRRHYSHRTEQSYCAWIVRYIRYHRLRHPATMGGEHVGAFLSSLATVRQVAVDRKSVV